MEVIKKIAPKYWLGYYIVYAVTLIIMTIRYGRLITEGTDPERIFIAAAIFGVSTGVALTAAIASEGVGFLILLIPNRIREIKEEGSAEGFAKGSAEGFAKGNEEGFTKGREAGRAEGREEGRAEALAEVEARAKAQSEKREEERAEAQSERREEGLNGGGERLLKTAQDSDEGRPRDGRRRRKGASQRAARPIRPRRDYSRRAPRNLRQPHQRRQRSELGRADMSRSRADRGRRRSYGFPLSRE